MLLIRRVSFLAKQNFKTLKTSVVKESRRLATTAHVSEEALRNDASNVGEQKNEKYINTQENAPSTYRLIYPEFLPDPKPEFRNSLREKLERIDMMARRTIIDIPEFYVGSILAVTRSDPHAPGKSNRFVGICIQRTGCGLRAKFILRNVVDNEGVEVVYDVYDPTIQKVECLRCEKRLDDELFYLRDAAPEYSTFPFDMPMEILLEGMPVPVNKTIVPLKPPPWLVKWEQRDVKGIDRGDFKFSKKRIRKAKVSATPWEKYDLMKAYRRTIPEEEQKKIFSEVYSDLHQLEVTRRKLKLKRQFVRPKKMG